MDFYSFRKQHPDGYALTEEDEQKTRELLVGRRIVSAVILKELNRWGDEEVRGSLTLDDGTAIIVQPNEGCGGCDNGWYTLTHLATVDNAITDVRLHVEGEYTEDDYYYERRHSYRIYVIADNTEINAVQVDGDDGNGYYGTGYELFVIPPRS